MPVGPAGMSTIVRHMHELPHLHHSEQNIFHHGIGHGCMRRRISMHGHARSCIAAVFYGNPAILKPQIVQELHRLQSAIAHHSAFIVLRADGVVGQSDMVQIPEGIIVKLHIGACL